MRCRALLLALALVPCLAGPVRALEPDEVLVLVSGIFGDGAAVFDHLCHRRGLPRTNLLSLRGLPDGETISPADFERRVLGPLRADLARPERSRIRCLVVTGDIPLRVGPDPQPKGAPKPDPLETTAALDSELALALRPPATRARWAPNPLLAPGPLRPPSPLPDGPARPLLIARIDAPTRALAKGLIDRGLEAEREGLSGTLYFDARGEHGDGAYARHDQRIRDAAALAQAAGLRVKLDDRGALFGKGECPDAAVYVGWYALGSYVDSFSFAPGAVGWHVASSEAESLRRGNFWVKGLLEHGITATLGPTDEPYLESFPDPVAVLERLIEGKRTLAEIYWETIPQASWRQILVGDPLYRPRLAKPAAGPAAPGEPGTAPVPVPTPTAAPR